MSRTIGLGVLLVILVAGQLAAAVNRTEPQATNSSEPVKALASTAQLGDFAAHRFSSRNNITILHEVDAEEEEEEPPLTLNTHEVLPQKPLKKKPYLPLEKLLPSIEYVKPHPLKEYELHPVTFDFNLGDLEDLEHEVIKKGDLSSEEQHVLSNGNAPELSYKPTNPDDSDTVDVDISALPDSSFQPTTTTTTTTTTAATSTTAATTTTTAAAAATTTAATTTTSSTHILKILKNKPSPKKGRELLKQSDDELQLKTLGSTINSISHYLGSNGTASANSSTMAESLYGSANYFQIVTNLYDHFYWQISEIRTSVRTGCGLEMQAYLTGLHSNYEWAQKAYDASGRYRGQLLFGNDKWLGQLTFCMELNRQLSGSGERKHFELEFYVADISLQMPRLNRTLLSLGECLPKSCSAHDVQSILSLDPYARMLTMLGAHNASAQQPALQVLRVRTVPGLYSHWRQLKFQVFISFLLTLLLVMIVATYYQMRIDERRLVAAPIPAISAKCDAASKSGDYEAAYYGKPFELFQMRPLSSNGLVATDSTLDAHIDMNGNRQRHPDAATNSAEAMHGESTASTSVATVVGVAGKQTDKSEMTDYQVETGSCAGVAGTYEAEQPIALHQQLLLCFALQTNAKAILNIDKNKETHTSCLHGLRVFSVLWTMMVHTYLQMFAIGENKFERVITERSFWYQVIGNATFSVDSFFFISGLLVTLLYVKQERKPAGPPCTVFKRSFLDTMMMFLYRYLRLTPVYLFVVLFNDFAVRQGLDSSVFQPAKIEHNTCRIFWWRNILYINNFFPQHEMCMMWSWYMANDMQFYVMACLLLALSRKYFKAVAVTLVVFLVSSWSVSGIISLQHQYTHKVALPFESFDFLYDKPWQRVGAYIVGMFTGYALYRVKTPPKISRRLNLSLWACSLGVLFLVIFGVWPGELSVVNTAFYVSIGHTAFGCGLVWIVLSCCWGLAPTVNAILSYRVLWPLSRLTYCAYLIHPIIMFICSSHMSGTVHLNNPMILTTFLGNAVVSFGSAFVISALFEAPVIRILKICFKK
ncbi:hypothetical protein AWZ03_014168 [Drosophila navojoa]|uniref:Nose resistant-to-fluoxetine protein N-terminal domain-containing protein n=1 Tax=Drosophila navojoa TaxID=7232 RepID=A0A484ASM9_DRONA|nr:uncharacterized protein LOC115565183 isoform X3 [Drosophila navojoa]TDG39414.1 hypothetical protein AWZ03_014168 [Drosophila navojoa]